MKFFGRELTPEQHRAVLAVCSKVAANNAKLFEFLQRFRYHDQVAIIDQEAYDAVQAMPAADQMPYMRMCAGEGATLAEVLAIGGMKPVGIYKEACALMDDNRQQTAEMAAIVGLTKEELLTFLREWYPDMMDGPESL